MSPPVQQPRPQAPGVLGTQGRYPVHPVPPRTFTVCGQRLLPVGPLRMYACGITPYDVTHVGHAATFVWADLIASVARASGATTLVARNVTDVDDVLTQAAERAGWHYDELALTQEFLFDRDMKMLAVAPPDLTPRARGHVEAVVRLATALLDRGRAYEADGFVYFRGAEIPGACGLGEQEALEASRSYGDQDGVPGRESPFDVPLWRPSPPEQPAWPSPWGWGRPGWHAECAAMALSAFGSAVDVLVGGHDLAFPHHAYQAAMVEAATGVTPFARAVVHVGEVCRGGTKMAKSTGNLMLVSDVLGRHSPAAVRLALLNRPLTEHWDCTEEVFETAAGVVDQLRSVAAPQRPGHARSGPELHPGVLGALCEELDVPRALELALHEGGEAAGDLMSLLKLRP